MPLLAKDGYADLFCFNDGPSREEVSTRREPTAGRANETFFVGVESGTELFVSWFRFAEMRARSETEVSLGSLLVLIERERPSVFDWEVALSEALLFPGFGFPATGTSVWMKQQRLP